jgi:hypothetical protein
MKQPVRASGKLAGVIEGDTFRKTLQENHLLQRPPAIALDDTVLAQLEPAGVTTIVCDRPARGLRYVASLELFKRKRGRLNRGCGPQSFLCLKEWAVQPVLAPEQKED